MWVDRVSPGQDRLSAMPCADKITEHLLCRTLARGQRRTPRSFGCWLCVRRSKLTTKSHARCVRKATSSLHSVSHLGPGQGIWYFLHNAVIYRDDMPLHLSVAALHTDDVTREDRGSPQSRSSVPRFSFSLSTRRSTRSSSAPWAARQLRRAYGP